MDDYTVEVLHGNISQEEAEQIVNDLLSGQADATNRYDAMGIDMPDPEKICPGSD